ncbi:MAG: SLAC1 anion channel family protein [Piscinibacter sp.]|jgi:tellurite resistance protein|uniref:SLAC1 anion channel family protein n=1 Tax=Piscinibacter sp. TaxID=1903157 RepID=UPI0035B143FB
MNDTAPLKHLFPGWFAIPMGWAGLALAWHRAAPLMGETAQGVTLVAAGVAALAFVLIGAATLLRWQRHAQALREDLAHPVRHTFFAAIPVSALLLATLAVALFGPAAPGADALWWAASLAQFGVTLWVLAKWISGPAGGANHKPNWGAVTPVLFIPIVGNVLAPLAGVPLGHGAWASAQFGLGLLFWPLVLVLNFVRIAQAGLMPERLLPTLFIFAAPPAVVGVAALQYGAGAPLVWMLWGMALFQAAWAATQARRIAMLPFGLPHWGMSFPLAALAVLTLRLADTPEGRWLQLPGVALLALASLVILGLSFATVRGLRAGTLLAPEGPAVIPIQPQPGAA